MKTFNELMESCPKHDSAYVLYNGRWHKVEEHQLRYLCVLVASGKLSKDTLIKYSDGTITSFRSTGRLYEVGRNTNIFRLNSVLNRELNRIEFNK